MTGKRENGKPGGTSVVAKRSRKFFVPVDRNPEVQAARLQLPVCMQEQEIIEAVHANDVVLVTGATGTGKTTQVPQFLVEDGFGDANSPSSKGIIGVTQPRRVAAVSCAKRVAFEMNSHVGGVVGYQIRHDVKLESRTKIKFATDGVLLREAEDDILLRKYSAILIDEVHERSLNTDLLLSFLSRSVLMRRAKQDVLGCLKVIIMSATLDIEGVFSGEGALFPNPPIVRVPARQYPVTTHFARKTVANYVEEAFKKVSKIHCRLPQGGVLVFLSGRQEVEELCARLQDEFGSKKIKIPDSDGPELGISVLPFYALLPDHLQRRVFDELSEDVRKVVVATNVAETSVTVPGIAYVVDSGRVKEKLYKGSGANLLSSYEVRWVSQAAAEQRKGRAGRTGPGHCYRLYSSAVYDQQFEKFREPEILRVPADSVVLRLRAMGIRYVNKFPFPTRPDEKEIAAAEKLLTDLGALHGKDALSSLKPGPERELRSSERASSMLGVTEIGRNLAKLPLPPRFGKMLLSAHAEGGALPYTCRIAAILTVGTVLDKTASDFRERHRLLRHKRSDLMTELAAVCAAEHTGRQGNGNGMRAAGKLDIRGMRALCQELSLHLKSILEVIAIARQVEGMIGAGKDADSSLKPPSREVERQILRSFLSGFPDRVARRMTRHEAAARGVIPRRQKVAFVVANQEEPVFLESSSSVHLDTGVEFVCFSELVRVQVPKSRTEPEEERDDYEESDGEAEEEGAGDGGKDGNEEEGEGGSLAGGGETESRVVMRGTTVVERGWVIEEATSMCHFKVKGGAARAWYDRKVESVVESVAVSYGRQHWTLGQTGVPVGMLGQLDGAAAARERRRGHCVVFARALVSGAVRAELKVGLGKDVGEACVRAMAEVLERHGVFGVAELRRAVRQHGDILSGIVQACGGKGGGRLGEVWGRELEKMVQEEGGVEVVCGADEEDEDGRE